jgi:asparagine synthase (glutamine-hydrolysing)
MCGIAALIQTRQGQKPETVITQEVVESMRYRGPDDEGYYHDNSVSLGMCRLSIVDVRGGAQPIFNEDESLVLICNGEIYNHHSLRARLLSSGHEFRTSSDAEVIVHLYEDKGDAFIQELAGMFAFVLWDEKHKTVIAARDRIGIKPLYYHINNSYVAFCSEFYALVNALNLSPQLSNARIWEFLSYGFPVRNQHTVDQQVNKVAPGELVKIKTGQVKKHIYWEPKYSDGISILPKLKLEELTDKFFDVLRENLNCEVPSAIMLSGGLDSTALAISSAKLGFPLKAIVVGYEGRHACDERAEALTTADRIGLKIEQIVLNSTSSLSSFNEMIHFCDEPVSDIASIPQWEIYKRAYQSGLKVLHSGLGGDEIFYGYDMWNQIALSNEQDLGKSAINNRNCSGYFCHPALYRTRQFLDVAVIEDISNACMDVDTELAKQLQLDSLSGIDRIYHLLFKTWLPNNCLHLADRLSMAHSIELRVPLLDNRLVDYIHSLPLVDRFDSQKSKAVLKKLLSTMIEQKFLNRPKRGFTPPGNFIFDIISGSKEIIFDGYLATNFFKKGKLEKEWSNKEIPNIWFHIATFEHWYANTYSP